MTNKEIFHKEQHYRGKLLRLIAKSQNFTSADKALLRNQLSIPIGYLGVKAVIKRNKKLEAEILDKILSGETGFPPF